MSVFDLQANQDIKSNLFFGEPITIARYDRQKYPWIEKLTEKQLGFFWQPTEVDIYRDAKDFKDLTDQEKHIFTSNIKRQILLDSVQGRAPTAAFAPIASLPELETWIITWAFSETIHSRSYTHIIRNIYSDPGKIFDEITDIQEIVDCAKDISKYYDVLIELNTHLVANPGLYQGSEYEHKKALWLALMAVNVLEGVRFYVSFACSFAFAENKKMEGNAKIIKFIARDENVHLAFTQQALKALPKEDSDFLKIQKETEQECVQIFIDAVNQEKQWAKYLFQNGSMLGLTEELLNQYIEWIANKRMTAVGIKSPYKVSSNPLPWTQKWIAGSEVQPSPQQVTISSYLIGGVKQDINESTFKGIGL